MFVACQLIFSNKWEMLTCVTSYEDKYKTLLLKNVQSIA